MERVRFVFWWFLLTCCAEMNFPENVPLLRLPRGTLPVVRAVWWYNTWYLRAHPCGLYCVLFPLCLYGRLHAAMVASMSWQRMVRYL